MASRQFQLQAYSGNPLYLCAVRGGTTAFPASARGEGRLKIQKAARAIGESQLQCALLVTSTFSFKFLNQVALRRLGWPVSRVFFCRVGAKKLNQPGAITADHRSVGAGALRAPFLHTPPRRVEIPLSLTSCGGGVVFPRIFFCVFVCERKL